MHGCDIWQRLDEIERLRTAADTLGADFEDYPFIPPRRYGSLAVRRPSAAAPSDLASRRVVSRAVASGVAFQMLWK